MATVTNKELLEEMKRIEEKAELKVSHVNEKVEAVNLIANINQQNIKEVRKDMDGVFSIIQKVEDREDARDEKLNKAINKILLSTIALSFTVISGLVIFILTK